MSINYGCVIMNIMKYNMKNDTTTCIIIGELTCVLASQCTFLNIKCNCSS